MLIYFKEDEIVINTENVSSIEYLTFDDRPCLYFEVNGRMKDVKIFFSTKEEVFRVLDTILAAYDNQLKVLLIYDKKLGR